MVRMSLASLQQMKADGRKIVAVVVYDYQMARVVDRAHVDLVSVGDSIGVSLWGHADEEDLTLDEMLLACRAVRKGVTRALVSCDVPVSSMEEGGTALVRAAVRLSKEGGADLVKLDTGLVSLSAIAEVTRAGIPVWAQFSARSASVDQSWPGSPAQGAWGPPSGGPSSAATDHLVAEAKQLEAAGAVMLDFRHSGPAAGPAVTRAVTIPVIGGLGGGPWLDGRVRSLVA